MTHDHAGEHHGPGMQTYMAVFGALSGFTLVSFVCNYLARQGTITDQMSFIIILAVAVVKTCLVGLYFMHLKWDWKLTYFMLIPCFILAVMMMTVLLPDIVLAWNGEKSPWEYQMPAKEKSAAATH